MCTEYNVYMGVCSKPLQLLRVCVEMDSYVEMIHYNYATHTGTEKTGTQDS